MNREFIKDYDNVRNDRLVDMTKTDLINEYLQMEQKIEALEKRLSLSHKDLKKSTDDMTHTIQNFQTEIQRLETENDRLKSKRGMYYKLNSKIVPENLKNSRQKKS